MKKHLFVLLLAAGLLTSQAQPSPQLLDSAYSKAMTDYSQPGMAVAVINNGQVYFSKGYGRRHADRPEKIDNNTVFQLASLSKAFTAACIGVLVDEGKLKWDDRVTDHLPGFRLYDPWVTSQFTVRDLLTHRNGYLTFDGDLLWYGTNYDRREIVRRFAHLPPKHGFREKYGYNNIMFIAAALLIEEKSGMTWEKFVQDRLLTPLAMNTTFTEMKPFLLHANIAHPHVKGRPVKHLDYNNAAGAVGVNSNITDLVKWVNMWLNKGRAGDRQILKEITVREILSAQTPQGVGPRQEENGIHFRAAASGWMVQDFKGYKWIHHSGGLPGFILNIAMVPEKNLAVIVLTNGETIVPFALTNYTIDAFVATQPKDWFSELLPIHRAGAAEVRTIDLPAVPAIPVINGADLVGSYEDKMYGKASISVEGGKIRLVLEPASKLFSSDLELLDKLTYRVRFNDPFLPDGKVTFQLSSAGAVQAFTIDLPNPDFNFFNLKFEKKDPAQVRK